MKGKTVVISQEAFDYVRKFAFDKRRPIGKIVSEIILLNVDKAKEAEDQEQFRN